MRAEVTYRRMRDKDAQASRKDISFCSFLDICTIDSLIDAQQSEDFDHTKTRQEIFTSGKTVLAWCTSLLCLSPVALKMVEEAGACGWHFGFDDLAGADYAIDVMNGTIYFDHNGLQPESFSTSNYFRNLLIVAMIKSLRDVWQERRHNAFEDHYDIESTLLLERVRKADLDVVTALVAWELRSEGYPELWRHIIGSNEGDMAMTFSNHLERDPSSLYNGAALASSFDQWFRSMERIRACDHQTLEYLDSVLQSVPSGSVFGKARASRTAIEVLSCMPDKTAYLRGFGNNILRDPLYAGLNCPINQAHFMQILHDSKAVFVNNVPFRDAGLAARIFPEEFNLIPEYDADQDLENSAY